VLTETLRPWHIDLITRSSQGFFLRMPRPAAVRIFPLIRLPSGTEGMALRHAALLPAEAAAQTGRMRKPLVSGKRLYQNPANRHAVFQDGTLWKYRDTPIHGRTGKTDSWRQADMRPLPHQRYNDVTAVPTPFSRRHGAAKRYQG